MRDLQSIDAILPLVPRKAVCVQAGGNLGIFPKYLSQYFERVYSFEPSPELFPKMVTNAPEPNIYRFQAALGEKAGMVSVQCERRDHTGKPVHEGLTYVNDQPGAIPMLPLDAFQFPDVDLLYLDLEGYELYALRGALATIQACRPVIAVEINKNAAFYGLNDVAVRGFFITQNYKPAFTIKSDEVFVPL
jgi:FkbM family methyltransferase